MRYSCFSPHAGLYDYFADERTQPINADLPVPQLPAPRGKMGVVSALEAGRLLPAGVRRVGQGWHAQGIVSNCGREPFGASDGGGWFQERGWRWLVAAVGVGAVVWFVNSGVAQRLVRGE